MTEEPENEPDKGRVEEDDDDDDDVDPIDCERDEVAEERGLCLASSIFLSL